ncbi:hypothetical protein Enr10x_35520 [Gimesia panareensis]|uniref:WD domain, G-beta repeat n=1 Tax=Gimesia panareensis TaxID=2527978 RepID=A0A517Q9A8_9PLAN|nr:WD40 repeat domain-containing protein [Gimesia panareensis]QDT28212.1 hypothetical protein Enr10x_35520 [Gimesia panareensis]
MRARHCPTTFISALLSLSAVWLLILSGAHSAFAIEAKKPQLSLADTIQQQSQIPREQFYGEVKLMHAPNPMDVQFSEDGSVLFSQAETIRLWRSDTGAYLGSIAGPARFSRFAQLNHSRWLVTVDDSEADDQQGWYYSMPQLIPCLRVWDVHTGKCLAVRRLRVPINVERLWINSIATSTDSTWVLFGSRFVKEKAEQEPKSFLDGSSDDYCFLAGFQGPNLTPTCDLEFDELSNYRYLNYNSHNGKLLIYGETELACFDPDSQKIIWSTSGYQQGVKHDEIKGIINLEQPFQMELTESGKKRTFTPFIVQFESNSLYKVPAQSVDFSRLTLLNWGLIDPSTGKLLHHDLVMRKTGPGNYKTPKAENLKFPGPKDANKLNAWVYDKQEHAIKAVDLVEAWRVASKPVRDRTFTIRKARGDALGERWNLERDDLRDEAYVQTWNSNSGRMCIITGYTPEIDLYDLSTGNTIAQPSGTVNALSRFTSGKLAASLDWNDVSVFDLKAEGSLQRTFNTKALQNSCVALSVDASQLLVGEISGNAGVWDLSRRSKVFALEGGTEKLLRIAGNTTRNSIAALDQDGTLWRWQTPKAPAKPGEMQLLRAHSQKKPKRPEGYYLNEFDYRIPRSLCDLSANTELYLAFRAYSAEEEDNYGELSLGSPGEDLIARIHEGTGQSFYFEYKHGAVVELRAGQPQKQITPPVYYQSQLMQIRCTADGRFAILVFDTGQILILNLIAGTLEAIIPTGLSEIMDVNYHPQQQTLLVACFRGTITAWNSDTFLRTGLLQLNDARLEHLASQPAADGFDLVLGTWDTGLIVKQGVFKKADQKPTRLPALPFPVKLPGE